MRVSEAPAHFEPLDRAELIAWDHQASGHSTHGHPLEPFREELAAQGLPDARGLSQLRDGQKTRYAGLVICRQRPGTASGVTFMTLEDESGFVNLIVWKRVFDAHLELRRTEITAGSLARVPLRYPWMTVRIIAAIHMQALRLWKKKVPFHSHPSKILDRKLHERRS